MTHEPFIIKAHRIKSTLQHMNYICTRAKTHLHRSCFNKQVCLFKTRLWFLAERDGNCNHAFISPEHLAARRTEFILTVRDSRFLPLVINVKPCVSMATPVFCMCSSTYLKNTCVIVLYFTFAQRFFLNITKLDRYMS